ncbi:hypothetical protein VP01_3781g1 [Puccinia sorghi]|uniref:Uncharacterized protein n=1 Tax=Puccinia sorghi TaxID=27349 RepID=A0A0L6UTR1_9BASI|nr:hypothetical protein VP01_3781g1 [Puccinia sorghi]
MSSLLHSGKVKLWLQIKRRADSNQNFNNSKQNIQNLFLGCNKSSERECLLEELEKLLTVTLIFTTGGFCFHSVNRCEQPTNPKYGCEWRLNPVSGAERGVNRKPHLELGDFKPLLMGSIFDDPLSRGINSHPPQKVVWMHPNRGWITSLNKACFSFRNFTRKFQASSSIINAQNPQSTYNQPDGIKVVKKSVQAKEISKKNLNIFKHNKKQGMDLLLMHNIAHKYFIQNKRRIMIDLECKDKEVEDKIESTNQIQGLNNAGGVELLKADLPDQLSKNNNGSSLPSDLDILGSFNNTSLDFMCFFISLLLSFDIFFNECKNKIAATGFFFLFVWIKKNGRITIWIGVVDPFKQTPESPIYGEYLKERRTFKSFNNLGVPKLTFLSCHSLENNFGTLFLSLVLPRSSATSQCSRLKTKIDLLESFENLLFIICRARGTRKDFAQHHYVLKI